MDCVLLGMKAASIPRTAFASLLFCVRGKGGAPEEKKTYFFFICEL